MPKVVAKRWAELYLKKERECECTRLKKELLLSARRMHWCLLEQEGKRKKNIFFVHSLLILELLVCEIFSWNVFLLGHKGCRLVHSIPNLPNSFVSWVYIFQCAEQVPVHKQASKEQDTNVGPYLSHPPFACLVFCQHGKFLFCLCNQHRKILCVCFLPAPFSFLSGRLLWSSAACPHRRECLLSLVLRCTNPKIWMSTATYRYVTLKLR